MNELKTISDSKKEFHLNFPFVISPIYRRITDELLVELHLLKHQKAFKPDNVFAVGLTKVFDSFMQGYRPEDHKTRLFDALCKCNAIDSTEIKKNSSKTIEEVSNHSIEAIEEYLKNEAETENSPLSTLLSSIKKDNIFYSRLSVIGLFTILNTCKEGYKLKDDELSKKTEMIFTKIGYSSTRVEKDLENYKTSLDKLNQAIELMKESVAREERKGKERESNK